MTSYIGWWAQRPGGKWHLIESEVTDRMVTKCGRQLRFHTEDGDLSFVLEPRDRHCKVCAP